MTIVSGECNDDARDADLRHYGGGGRAHPAQRGLSGPFVAGVLDRLYEHLLSLPETAKFFERQDIGHRKKALVSWAERTIEGPYDEKFWKYLSQIGRMHLKYGIPIYQVIHLMAWIQDNVASALLASERPERDREAVAWSKLLTAQLDPMIAPYFEG